ncbi:MAG: hypothetical protein A2637_07270 [Candidatus Muproteobacteria bacterium RIFCSPHIGHO2_01_FULL_65_16]|uniref:DUF3192 domain-containing protein n=2 Tax=Candidatus Muproteobacteria TaxID=1817795 RepID=A0A1F6TKM2_9PROT|nr:MAG: hypothetical protein A2637_07270 [Candidatus Muproteobacteria bacterium RIFCSPHIGHO2_01_FULL_65_16]OGI48565.1 MAG: hypothetical protein A3B81_07865 [Candidatus Muproteobacteria bacterium RIFCSPHIGHO2_02_FULL_65_16]
MYQFIKAVFMLLVAVSIASCSGTTEDGVEIVSYKTMLSRNLSNLNKLSVGMTKSQVMDIMGNFAAKTGDSLIPNPYKTEPFSAGKAQYEALYYLTRKYPPFTSIKLSQATPVVLKAGKVIGWSVDALQKARAGGIEK